VIRYVYVQLPGRPPAPFVTVTVRPPLAAPENELTEQPAQVDTGADRTVLPLSTVRHLGLLPLRWLDFEGLGGVTTRLATYALEVRIDGLNPLTVEVTAAEEPWILLGRDVDNHFRMLLDGPASALEIG
jgi:hypothetical protein